MTKYKVGGASVFKVDNVGTAGTSLTNQQAFIDTIDGVGKEFMILDVTTFADVGERVVPGIQVGQEFTVSGPWDNAGTGPDEVYSSMVKTITACEWFPAGTASSRRKYAFDALVVNYQITGAVKELVRYETRLKVSGTVTASTV
jgi:hypothetical protein|tara:strand:- start:7017 stop:7448 length:432 start_codon:yes stop_codon:yes gene_type:complete